MDLSSSTLLPEADPCRVDPPATAFMAHEGDNTSERPSATGSAASHREGKYLTFSMAGEEHAIGILNIREIIGMMPITSIPQTPEFVKGVINLRGKVIPVVDLRLRFSMEAMDYTDRTCIIVVESFAKASNIAIGIVVDSVSEVLSIKEEDIEDTPTFGINLNTDYILGVAKMEGNVKILLDIHRILHAEDLSLPRLAAN